jgi:hypothetical protein
LLAEENFMAEISYMVESFPCDFPKISEEIPPSAMGYVPT